MRVFIDNDFDESSKAGLFNPKYHIYLDDSEPLEIKELSMEDELAKSMPLVKKWYRIYLVKFSKTKSQTLKLVFKSDDYGQIRLIFEKGE